MIPFSRPTTSIEEEEALIRVVRSGLLTPGLETAAFEEEFSTYISPPSEHYYCIYTNSCTSALKMAFKWAKEQGKTHVRYPLNTFCATYSAAEEMGLETKSYDDLVVTTSRDIKVVMHYGGVLHTMNDCDIEDSAHRIEPNDPLIGKIRCYSFHGSKNMTTNGAGGMFVTNDKDIYERARLYWRDGLSTSTADRINGNPFYTVEAMAGGYDATDGAAAFGRAQLRKLPDFIARRNDIRDAYNNAFKAQWGGNHLYPYFLDSSDLVGDFIGRMREKGVHCMYHYPGTGWNGVSLPIYPNLTDSNVEYIINAVNETAKVLSKR